MRGQSHQKLFIYRLLTRHGCLPVAGSRQVTRLEAENSVPDRLCYCPPSAAKPVIVSKYKLRPGPADLHLLVGSWSLQEIAYICYICVWLENSFDPPEGHPVQLTYTFLIRLSSQFQFSLSAVTLGYLSQWVSLSQLGTRGGNFKEIELSRLS
jgi:hypothetical protein